MEQVSLWGDEFNVNDEIATKKILKKAKQPKVVKEVTTEKLLKSKKVSIEEKMAAIEADVNRILGAYKDSTVVIKNENDFKKYIDAAINNGNLAIDTETNNSLNTFDCKLMGLCLYTPNQKNAYIPVNHVDKDGNRLTYQITEQMIKSQLSRCDNVFKVFHNATFDIEVIKTTCGIKLKADWDTMSGAQVLNENELKSLKAQYKLHINPDQDKYDIEHLFKGLPYEIFDPELFALYAATDSYMTYKLYEYQKKEFEKPENKEIYELFKTIEVPILDVVVDMELEGIEVDLEYANKISAIYHGRSDEVQSRIDKELERLQPIISEWRLTPEANAKQVVNGRQQKSLSEKLSDPPELSSPTQMAIILYDILKAPVIDKKMPRGTGAEILEALQNSIPLCKLLVEKRGIDILINTFIDKMKEVIQKDGRVHARFNTCGTQTGRFSSSDPNLQNIPSHDKVIRGIFKAPHGYSIIGSDFSAQEPRSLCSLSGDKHMREAYEQGQDLYAVIASKCFHNDYWDNLEFNKEGKLQPEGKARRSKAKTVLLGVTYGMGSGTLAERMNLSREESEAIISDFYKGFPGVEKFTKDSQNMLKKVGYVTDAFGRRRHIPDAMLPEYEITPVKVNYNFNPLLDVPEHIDYTTEALISNYKDKLSKAKWKKDKDLIIKQAEKDGLSIKNNGGFINRALRQCLNARIQGTAASMTKLAMIMIHNDKELNDLGFKLLVTVHDEVFGIAPTENSARCGERLCEVMVDAAKVKCSSVPWKCDPYVTKRWYSDELSAEVLKDFNKVKDINKIMEKYPMIKQKYIEQMCSGTYDPNLYEDI